jgi:hypothetical protein
MSVLGAKAFVDYAELLRAGDGDQLSEGNG